MTSTLATTGGTLIYDTMGDAAETIVFVHGAGREPPQLVAADPALPRSLSLRDLRGARLGTEPGSLRRGACGVSPRP